MTVKSAESQLLGDWGSELTMDDLAKVGGGYNAEVAAADPGNWRQIEGYGGQLVWQYRLSGPYGAPVW